MENKFIMSLSLNVLNHLGINLYSNIPAVLSEIVANSWDADAKRVDITIAEDQIIIEDDCSIAQNFHITSGDSPLVIREKNNNFRKCFYH